MSAIEIYFLKPACPDSTHFETLGVGKADTESGQTAADLIAEVQLQ